MTIARSLRTAIIVSTPAMVAAGAGIAHGMVAEQEVTRCQQEHEATACARTRTTRDEQELHPHEIERAAGSGSDVARQLSGLRAEFAQGSMAPSISVQL